MRRRAWGLITAGLMALAACDGGTEIEGPGTLRATVRGPAEAGAAVLELRGTGLGPVEGVGLTRAFSSRVSEGSNGGPDVLRIVLVNEEPGDLRFDVDVEDLAADRPVGTVISVVDGSNEPFLAPDNFEVDLDG